MSTVAHLIIEADLGTEMLFLLALRRGCRLLERVYQLFGALVKRSVCIRAIINCDRILIDNHHSLAIDTHSFLLPNSSC